MICLLNSFCYVSEYSSFGSPPPQILTTHFLFESISFGGCPFLVVKLFWD